MPACRSGEQHDNTSRQGANGSTGLIRGRRRLGCRSPARAAQHCRRPVDRGASGDMAKPLRCYLGRHRWRAMKNDAGEPYMECRDCKKFRDVANPPPDSIHGG